MDEKQKQYVQLCRDQLLVKKQMAYMSAMSVMGGMGTSMSYMGFMGAAIRGGGFGGGGGAMGGVLEICSRGVYCNISSKFIINFIPCYNCIKRKH